MRRLAAGVLECLEQRPFQAAAVDDHEIGGGYLAEVPRCGLERVGVGLERHERTHLEAVSGNVLGDVREETLGGDHVEGAVAGRRAVAAPAGSEHGGHGQRPEEGLEEWNHGAARSAVPRHAHSPTAGRARSARLPHAGHSPLSCRKCSVMR